MLKMLRNRKGFSLVELIVVIVILGILVAIAVPSLVGYIKKANVAADMAAASGLSNAAMAYVTEHYNDIDHTKSTPVDITITELADAYTADTWPKAKAVTGAMTVTYTPTTKVVAVSAGGKQILPSKTGQDPYPAP